MIKARTITINVIVFLLRYLLINVEYHFIFFLSSKSKIAELIESKVHYHPSWNANIMCVKDYPNVYVSARNWIFLYTLNVFTFWQLHILLTRVCRDARNEKIPSSFYDNSFCTMVQEALKNTYKIRKCIDHFKID